MVLGQHAVANLNPRTVITVTRTRNACDIALESGKALFDIRRNDAREAHLTAGEEFNRYNPQRLVVEDHAIRQLRIGGNYQSTDPEGFVAAFRPMGVRRVESVPTDSSVVLTRPVGTRVAN